MDTPDTIPIEEFNAAPNLSHSISPPSSLPDSIPIDEFNAAPATPDSISMEEFNAATPDKDNSKYQTTGQKVLTAIEGAGQGFAGPVATGVEMGLHKMGVPGISPEEQEARKEANPYLHMGAEAAGFAGSMYVGVGEAAILAKLGTKAIQGAKLAEATSIGGRLAAAAVGGAAEMAALQAGNEVSKYINNAPQSVGSVVSDVGLSALLGGVAGPVFSGAGMAIKGVINNPEIKNFIDRLAFRRANIDPHEMIRNEADNVVNVFQEMSNEIGGPTGLKAQAIRNLLPKEVSTKISSQLQELADRSAEALARMEKQGVPERLQSRFRSELETFMETASNPKASSADNFDALNNFKKSLQDYSKGNWGPFSIPSHHEAYDFINITKNLSHDVRNALENTGVWGEAANLQKNLNKSWIKTLPAFKDFAKKFMTRVGDNLEISGDKFSTYMNQAGKATSTTDKQKMLGNFIDAMDNHFKTVDSLYKAAGVDNPHGAVGMSTLKESLQRSSLGNRLADLWHDKLSAPALGSVAGATVGGHLGSVFGQGLGGVYLGKEILGPIFTNMLRPMLEKYPNVDVEALRQGMAYTKAVMKGEKNLENAVGSLFVGAGKTFPSNVMPSHKDLEKLDERAKEIAAKPDKLISAPGKVGYYRQGHDTAMAKTMGDAIAYVNKERPTPHKVLPLDGTPKVSDMEKTAFEKTLTIVQQPLSVLKLIKDGTLTPKDVTTLKTVYPEYYEAMSEKINSYLVSQIHEGDTIPYSTRLAIGLFLGQPMDSSMTSLQIQAAQPIPQALQPPQQPMEGRKGKSALNKTAQTYKTPLQAAEGDRGSRD